MGSEEYQGCGQDIQIRIHYEKVVTRRRAVGWHMEKCRRGQVPSGYEVSRPAVFALVVGCKKPNR